MLRRGQVGSDLQAQRQILSVTVLPTQFARRKGFVQTCQVIEAVYLEINPPPKN